MDEGLGTNHYVGVQQLGNVDEPKEGGKHPHGPIQPALAVSFGFHTRVENVCWAVADS